MDKKLNREQALKRIEEFLAEKIKNDEKFKNVSLNIVIEMLEEASKRKVPAIKIEKYFDVLMLERERVLNKSEEVLNMVCVEEFSRLFTNKKTYIFEICPTIKLHEAIIIFISAITLIVSIACLFV